MVGFFEPIISRVWGQRRFALIDLDSVVDPTQECTRRLTPFLAILNVN